MNIFLTSRYNFLIGLMLLNASVWAQTPSPSTNQNYVMEQTIRESGITSTSQLGSKTVSQVNRSVQYVDGLGRPKQAVMYGASPLQKDVIQHFEYDNFGREQYKYLPYKNNSTTGAYYSSAASATVSFYNSLKSDNNPFSRSIFESSPINRVLKQGAPGTAWQPNPTISTNDHSMRFEYSTNVANEVYQWEITALGVCKLASGHFYNANELRVSVSKDENWSSTQTYALAGTVKEYKDKQGRVVLKRSYNINNTNNGVDKYDTYYVYDNLGNLRVVLPPEAINQLGTSLTSISDSYIKTTNTTITTSTGTYYYCPGVTITLSATHTYSPGFEVKPYPLNADIVDQYLFTYKYDDRQRMIEKKVPGAQPVYMVYDDRDRLVLTQDGEQRKTSTWLFTKYDALNRPVLTGEKVISGTQSTAQTTVNNFYLSNPTKFYEYRSGTSTTDDQGYSDQSYPAGLSNSNYLTASYYDNYGFIAHTDLNYPASPPSPYTPFSSSSRLTAPKGQVTGGKVKVLNSTTWLESAVYYDNKYRVIYTSARNNKGGWEKVFSKQNFVGNPTNERYIHTAAGQSTLIINKIFDYDHVSRLKSIKYRVGDSGTLVTLLSNKYNEIGELTTKYLHGDATANKQAIDYKYNIRGWLTDINDPTSVSLSGDYFGMKLKYNENPIAALNSEAQYNGNISEIQWQNAQTTTLSGYGFKYDDLNRLNTSHFGSGTSFTASDGYWDENLSYDFNGNIGTLMRKAAGQTVDNLSYNYTGNQLDYVNDANPYAGEENHFKDGNTNSDDYSYDANGNMNQDKNKGITSILYNYLNLPKLITFGNGNTIEYIYDASGVKLQKVVKESGQPDKITDYIGGIVYEDNTRKFMSTEEGRIMLEGDPIYQYHMKDHLGNMRLTFTTAEGAANTSTYMATMEPEAATLETATFKNIESTQQEDKIYNHTLGGKASARLNAMEDRVMGPSMTLHVMPGDTVRMQVQAKYFKKAKKKDPIVGMAAIVAASVGVGTIGEAPQIASGLNEVLGLGQVGLASKDNSIPKAYINYLFFDKEGTFKKGGFKQVSEAALGSFEELSLEYFPEEEGTMMIYTANQTAEPLDVYMDDLKVMHTEGPIVRTDDYYPFGLTFNTSERSGYLTNNFLYNAKELQEDLGLDLYDYGARMYDAAIGRWHVVDPMSERRIDWSNYCYVLNNPILRLDPFGLTDYTYNKKTGDISEVTYDDKNEQAANDAAEKDRIVKMDKNGNVKRYKRGKKEGQVKSTSVKEIEKGILEDDQNIKNNGEIFNVGGEGQPSVDGVEDFALKLSVLAGVEIKGAYFSSNKNGSTSAITIGVYKNNELKKSRGAGIGLGRKQGLYETGIYHTHPGTGEITGNPGRDRPSGDDDEYKNNALKQNPNLRFFIITAPEYYGRPNIKRKF